MKEFELKYGCNPNQKPARIFMEDGGDLPLKVLNGRPGYINFLDALPASWTTCRASTIALWPAPMPGPGARTGSAPSATGQPSPTCAT